MTAQFEDERDADKSQSPEETETLSRHFAYLSDLIDKGVTITETNCPEDSFGFLTHLCRSGILAPNV